MFKPSVQIIARVSWFWVLVVQKGAFKIFNHIPKKIKKYIDDLDFDPYFSC